MIQLRNEMVGYLDGKKIPELKNEERFCSKCPQLTVCSLLNDIEAKKNANPTSCEAFYSTAIQHLTEEHRKYFNKWYRMLEYEFSDYKQFDAGEMIWWKPRDQLEAAGFTVFNLKLIHQNNKNDCDEYTGERFYLFDFEKDKNELVETILVICTKIKIHIHLFKAYSFF